MGFELKLARMCVAADQRAKRMLARQAKDFAEIVGVGLRSGGWSRLSIKTHRRLEAVSARAQAAAQLADAAGFVRERVFEAANGKVIDLQLKYDLRTMQDQVYSLFDERRAPDRGFVYVAWSARPAKFHYVGKATRVDRMNLSTHGKLSHAAAHCTNLSLLFPSQSINGHLSGLEASVCRVIEQSTGRLPVLNSRRELVPAGHGTATLDFLAGFLQHVASNLRRD